MPAYMEIYLNAYPAGKDLSDECYEKYYNRNLQSMTEFDHVNFYGMFEDGQLIATMKLIDFDMNLFGQMRRSTGLMALGVHPLHKRKGAARDMVKFFEEYTVESGGTHTCALKGRSFQAVSSARTGQALYWSLPANSALSELSTSVSSQS
jgi:hypothetical protein